jgi:hypothetical protein
MTIEAFIAVPEDAEIDVKIGAKEQELQAVQRSRRGSSKTRQRRRSMPCPQARPSRTRSPPFEALRTSLAAYNAAVAAANTVIATKKRETQVADIRTIQTTLANLKAQNRADASVSPPNLVG